jgi:von Willebrand factor type A domain
LNPQNCNNGGWKFFDKALFSPYLLRIKMHQQPNISFERGAKNTLAFLVSLVGHATLLIVLACWAFVAGRPADGVTVLAFSGESQDTLLEMSPSSNANLDSDDDSSSESLFKESEFEFTPSEVTLPAGSTEVSVDTASQMLTSLKAISEGLDTRGSGRGASFFGSYAQGGRFVYVIDSSKSMKGDRWTIAKKNLIESLKSLSRDQEFFVICFDEQTSLLFNCTPDEMEFKRVNEVIIDRVSRWLRSRTLGPATMPAEALQYALALQPDAIFLLSDGELQDNTLPLLRMINVAQGSRKQTPIHAIHLLSEQGLGTLRQLAQDNGGTFRHITK